MAGSFLGADCSHYAPCGISAPRKLLAHAGQEG
nr:MAG TPA: hypothetical protein [Caudoviricetes sp.]